MSVIKDMLDTFSAVKNNDHAVTKKIEAVMLHARARQMQRQDRKHILLSISIGLATRLIIAFIGFLTAPYFKTAIFIISTCAAGAAFLLSDIFQISSLSAAASAYVVVYLLSDFKATMNFMRSFIVDICDILLLGSLTKFLSRVL